MEFQDSSGLAEPRRIARILCKIRSENSEGANYRKTRNLLRFIGLTSRGRQGLDAAMFLHAFEPLPRWRSPLLRAVAPLYRNRKKTEGRYTDELGQTAHCTLTTAPRRSTCTNPPSSKHQRGVRAGGRRKAGGGGNGEGKITPTQHLSHPFYFFELRSSFCARIIFLLFHDNYNDTFSSKEEIRRMKE